MKWLSVCVLAVVIATVIVTADEECPTRKKMRSRAEYPNPLDEADVDKCGRFGQRSHICDPDCIMTYNQANYLENLIQQIENNTNCPCAKHYCSEDDPGYRFGIALVNKMEKDENMLIDAPTQLDNARLYSYTLEQRWNWGKCNEDIIIFFSLNDSVLYTMTGKEAAKKITPTMVGEVSMKWRFAFGKDMYIYRGLEGMITDFRDIITGNYSSGLQRVNPPQTQAVIGRRNSAPRSFTSFITLILGIVTVLIALS